MISWLSRMIILCVALWCVGLILFVSRIESVSPYEGKAEAAVVFTGGGERVEAGLDLLRQRKVQRLLISGVHPDVKVKELLVINHQPAELASKIDLGFSAQDTLGNAEETTEWVQRHKILSLIVVTAYYHMPRALIHLGEQLPDVALYPYPVVPKMFRHREWLHDPVARRSLLSDYNKFLLTYPQILLLRYSD